MICVLTLTPSLADSVQPLGDRLIFSRPRDQSLSMKKALLQLNIDGLVHELFETPTLDRFIAANHPHPRDLAACALQKAFQVRGRLAALLILYKWSDITYAKIPVETRAEVYCRALQGQVMASDDAWGSLWWEADAGLLGYHVVTQGPVAIPFLVALLGDETVRNRYHGDGEKAVTLEMRHYRIKDFAAYYISKIRAYDLPWCPEFAARDAAIEEMRTALKL
jgi:hypothetical protein